MKTFSDSSLNRLVDTKKTKLKEFTEVYDVLISGDSFLAVTDSKTPQEFSDSSGGRVRLYNVNMAGEVQWFKDIEPH